MEDSSKKVKHKLNNLISVISLSTYKLSKIANKYEDGELTEIVFKIEKIVKEMKDIFNKEKSDE